MVFAVRHWISNHETGISENRGGEGKVYPNTIGNVFYGSLYGSRGYMVIDGYRSYKTWLGKEQELGPSATATAIIMPILTPLCAAASARI